MATTADSRASALSDELVMTIIEGVAASSGTEPMELPPLGHTIDPEAIEALVDGDGFCDLAFTYYDHVVTVEGDGHVRVSSLDEC